ncbi:Rieske (2Fe-2S) protein [Mycobacterium hodleri]|uniref:Cytochrome bc1 complex Rieske iron-sulfur subunit n=1 Tax=Mycolicibacterium hodleri TaxID=49897 RepID=A0A544VSM8_9MYCO|nr:Rieske (2Fe-2S) protein [Mycolicibacterium hodleri]TQR82980.1 Rieske (2Fe-2S) protein [Mycolicibacterium hodleri]
MLEHIRPPRRAVIVGAGLGALATAAAACSSADTPSAPASESPAAASPTGAPASGALTKTTDVPVGSGVIVGDTVITQPTTGVFKGFSSVCPHAGCNVNAITDGKIICPCHKSEFNLDGTVAQGPAKKPLEAKAVTVQGESIVAG